MAPSTKKHWANNMKDQLLWHIVLVVARRLAVPLLAAGIALLGDASILDGALSDALRDVLVRSNS